MPPWLPIAWKLAWEIRLPRTSIASPAEKPLSVPEGASYSARSAKVALAPVNVTLWPAVQTPSSTSVALSSITSDPVPDRAPTASVPPCAAMVPLLATVP